jgi:putative membrane protein
VKPALFCLLTLASCSPAPLPDNATATTNATTTAEPALTTPKSPAQRFADETAAGNAFKVASGNLAMAKGSTAAIRKYAKMLVDDGNQSTMQLKIAAAQAPGVLPNPSLGEEQTAQLSALQAASGAAFDAAFKQQQATANERMLAAQRNYAASGDDAALRSFAEQNAPFVLRAVRLGKEL